MEAAARDARLEIYDAAGRLVRSMALGDLDAGPGHVRWDGHDDEGAPLPSGTYFYRLSHERGRTEARSAFLVR
jgi:flagellar hook assembly protein FlgD